MTTTPPEASGTGPSREPVTDDGSTRTDRPGDPRGGPRVSTEQVVDLHRLRRTTGAASRVAGVAGGIARHLDVDPLLIRVLFVVLALFGGSGLLLYVACWLLVPEDGHERAPLGLGEQGRVAALVAAGVLFLLVLFGGVVGRDVFWPVLLGAGIVAAVLLAQGGSRSGTTSRPPRPAAAPDPADQEVVTHDDASWGGPGAPYSPPAWTPPPPPPDPRRRGPVLFWAVVAAVLLGWGVLGTVDVAGVDVPFPAYPALALTLIGAGLVLGAFWGRAGGLIAIGLLTVPVLGLSTAAEDWEGGRDLTYAPAAGETVPDRLEHDAGRFVVDLSGIDAEELDGRTLRISHGVGELVVVVPDEVDADVSVDVGVGDASLFGASTGGGAGISRSAYDEGSEDVDLTLDVDLGLGDLEVVREGAR